MSFLSVVLSENFLTVMADSRASELYTDGRYHRTLSEKAEKIKMIGKNVFYGITGILEDAEAFMDKSHFKENILENEKLKDTQMLNHFFEQYRELNQSIQSYRIVFGGFSYENFLKVYSIDSGEEYIDELKCNEGQIRYLLCPSVYWKNDFPQQMFQQLYSSCDGSVNSVLLVQKMLNDLIADRDQTVNKITKHIVFIR